MHGPSILPGRIHILRFLTLVCFLCLVAPAASAAGLAISVLDNAGKPVADAVLYAIPEGAAPAAARATTAILDQIDKEFVPFVLPVQTGTQVRFPNQDNIRHNVYSFSPAKTFSLELYTGTAAPPVTFDKAGVVVMGCNIHDKMLAYILVVDTPHFARTEAPGTVLLKDLPQGRYEIRAWHPRLVDMAEPVAQKIAIGAADAKLAFTLALKPERKRGHK